MIQYGTLKPDTVRACLGEAYETEFPLKSEAWQAFCELLKQFGLSPLRVRMMSLRPRGCPGILALYAGAGSGDRIDAIAFGESREVLAVRKDMGLRPWVK